MVEETRSTDFLDFTQIKDYLSGNARVIWYQTYRDPDNRKIDPLANKLNNCIV